MGVPVAWRQRRLRPRPGRTVRLSEKELEVLRELARGKQTEHIARQLIVSPHTVRSHVKNSMKKLGAKTRAEAVAIAMSEGAIEYEADDD